MSGVVAHSTRSSLDRGASASVCNDSRDSVKIVEDNLDECVLCDLCVEAAPEGKVQVIKLY